MGDESTANVAYEPPAIVVLGSLEQLTLGGTPGAPETVGSFSIIP